MIGKRCSVALYLAGDRNFGGLLGTDPLHEPGAPGFQGRPALGSVQQDAGDLEQVGPQQPVAPFGTDDGAGQAHRWPDYGGKRLSMRRQLRHYPPNIPSGEPAVA